MVEEGAEGEAGATRKKETKKEGEREEEGRGWEELGWPFTIRTLSIKALSLIK